MMKYDKRNFNIHLKMPKTKIIFFFGNILHHNAGILSQDAKKRISFYQPSTDFPVMGAKKNKFLTHNIFHFIHLKKKQHVA